MGGQNVLTGSVESQSGDVAQLKAGDGATFEVRLRETSAAIGSKMSIAVRRDRIALRRKAAETPSAAANSLAGVVVATEYQGSYVKVTLQTASNI